jgi:hypothetical protein
MLESRLKRSQERDPVKMEDVKDANAESILRTALQVQSIRHAV